MRKEISWEQLAEEKFVLLDKRYSLNSIVRKSFQRLGIAPHIAFECDQADTILGLVEENFGVTMLSRRIATTRYAVTAIPLEHPLSRNTVLVVPWELEQKRKLAQRFVQHMVGFFQEKGDEVL